MSTEASALPIDVRYRNVEVGFIRGQVISPEHAAMAAQSTEAPPRYVSASDYIETVVVLKDEKGMTWREVTEWFAAKGIPFSQSSIQSAYFKHSRR